MNNDQQETQAQELSDWGSGVSSEEEAAGGLQGDSRSAKQQLLKLEGWFQGMQTQLENNPAPMTQSSRGFGSESFSQESEVVRGQLISAERKAQQFFEHLADGVQSKRTDSHNAEKYGSRGSWRKNDHISYRSVESGFSAESYADWQRGAAVGEEAERRSQTSQELIAVREGSGFPSGKGSSNQQQEEEGQNTDREQSLTEIAAVLKGNLAGRQPYSGELELYHELRDLPVAELPAKLSEDAELRVQMDRLLLPQNPSLSTVDLCCKQYVARSFFVWLPAELVRPCPSDGRCPHKLWSAQPTPIVQTPPSNEATLFYSSGRFVPVDRNLHPLFTDCSGCTPASLAAAALGRLAAARSAGSYFTIPHDAEGVSRQCLVTRAQTTLHCWPSPICAGRPLVTS